jgi:hypothetical protein
MKRNLLVPFLGLGLALISACSSDRETRSSSVPATAQASTVENPTPTPAAQPPAAASTPLPSGDPSSSGLVPVEERSKPQGTASEAGTPARSPRPLSPETTPLAPMGVVDDRPSVIPSISDERPPDPEIDAVRRGKRTVEPIAVELGGGYPSAEDLARAILDGVRRNDSHLLHGLRVTQREFATIFWPEFPQSRPAMNIEANDAWFFHDASCHDGVSESISAFGGRELQLVEVRCTKGRMDFTNFDLYDGIVIDAIDSAGETISIPWAITFAERNGVWKAYMFKD